MNKSIRKLSNTSAKLSYTIVELIIFMGMLTIILLVLTEVFGSILEVRLEAESTSSVEQDGKYVLSRLSYDISRAQAINIPVNDGDTTQNLELVIDGVSNTYNLVSGNLILSDSISSDNLNSSLTSISNPSFRRIGNSDAKDTIQFSFTLTSITERKSGPEIRSFRTTVGLR